jgi:hypothetical protein
MDARHPFDTNGRDRTRQKQRRHLRFCEDTLVEHVAKELPRLNLDGADADLVERTLRRRATQLRKSVSSEALAAMRAAVVAEPLATVAQLQDNYCAAHSDAINELRKEAAAGQRLSLYAPDAPEDGPPTDGLNDYVMHLIWADDAAGDYLDPRVASVRGV